MTMYTKIQQFLDLQEIVNAETSKIFKPIRDEVERQDKKYILFPPVTDTLSVEWLVRCSKRSFISNFVYLVLKIEPSQETDELTLVLASHEGAIT